MIVVPFPNFSLSAKVLETGRLIDSVDLIWNMINETSWDRRNDAYSSRSGQMWGLNLNALADYGNYMNKELIARGDKSVLLHPELFQVKRVPYAYPWWFGKPEFHATHRKFLSLKNPEYYSQFWPTARAGSIQVWPKHSPTGPTIEEVIGV